MNKFTCIKPGCNEVYLTKDDEPYYCESCQTVKQKIAREVDKKMAGRVTTQVKSDLQLYDEALERSNLVKGGIRVVNAKCTKDTISHTMKMYIKWRTVQGVWSPGQNCVSWGNVKARSNE